MLDRCVISPSRSEGSLVSNLQADGLLEGTTDVKTDTRSWSGKHDTLVKGHSLLDPFSPLHHQWTA